MQTVIVTMTVECDIESYDNKTEGAFKLDKTDFVTLKNVKVPDKVTLAASNVVIID